jgi:hypothetical protein
MDAFVLSYTDKQGAFKLSGAPGEYILLTQPPGEKQLKLFDYVRVHAAAAPRVALKAGETGSVEIVMPLD